MLDESLGTLRSLSTRQYADLGRSWHRRETVIGGVTS
jgi:hypothetical protein